MEVISRGAFPYRLSGSLLFPLFLISWCFILRNRIFGCSLITTWKSSKISLKLGKRYSMTKLRFWWRWKNRDLCSISRLSSLNSVNFFTVFLGGKTLHRKLIDSVVHCALLRCTRKTAWCRLPERYIVTTTKTQNCCTLVAAMGSFLINLTILERRSTSKLSNFSIRKQRSTSSCAGYLDARTNKEKS